jgi:hypothetical protein
VELGSLIASSPVHSSEKVRSQMAHTNPAKNEPKYMFSALANPYWPAR